MTGGLVVSEEVPDCSLSPLCTRVLLFVSGGRVSVWMAVVTLLVRLTALSSVDGGVLWLEGPPIASEADSTPPLVGWDGALVGGLVGRQPAVSSGSGWISSANCSVAGRSGAWVGDNWGTLVYYSIPLCITLYMYCNELNLLERALLLCLGISWTLWSGEGCCGGEGS